MTETVMFVDGVLYTEAQQASFNMRLRPDGVLLDSTLGTLAISTPGSMAIRVGPGEALVRGFLYANDANKDLTVTANASGSTRIDTLVLRLDTAANTCIATIHVGTPGAGAPTLTQVVGGVWEWPIMDIPVINGASTMVGVTFTYRWLMSQWPVVDLDPLVALDADVTAEASARATAVSGEATARTSADSSEATTRANADTSESTARVNGDNAEITARGNAITSEASTRSSADSSEATTRSNADASEASTRSSAVTALNTRVDVEGNHCRGTISAAGAGTNGHGYSGISHVGTGQYQITCTNTYTTMIIQVTPRYISGAGNTLCPKAVQDNNTQFTVYMATGAGLIDNDFFFNVQEA